MKVASPEPPRAVSNVSLMSRRGSKANGNVRGERRVRRHMLGPVVLSQEDSIALGCRRRRMSETRGTATTSEAWHCSSGGRGTQFEQGSNRNCSLFVEQRIHET